jgi:hypothetical protein
MVHSASADYAEDPSVQQRIVCAESPTMLAVILIRSSLNAGVWGTVAASSHPMAVSAAHFILSGI